MSDNTFWSIFWFSIFGMPWVGLAIFGLGMIKSSTKPKE